MYFITHHELPDYSLGQIAFAVFQALSLSAIVLNSRDRQGMYGMQHFRTPRNVPYNRL